MENQSHPHKNDLHAKSKVPEARRIIEGCPKFKTFEIAHLSIDDITITKPIVTTSNFFEEFLVHIGRSEPLWTHNTLYFI